MNTNVLMEKIAAVRPDVFEELKSAIPEIEASPFRDEITAELDGLAKLAMPAFLQGLGGKASQFAAGHPKVMSTLGRAGVAATGIGAAVGAGIAYHLAGDMLDATKRGITQTRNYKQMLEVNPDLQDKPADEVKRVFQTLHRFGGPEFSTDPLVAGSFVRNNIGLASGEGGTEVNLKTITDLIKARSELGGIKKLPVPGNLPWKGPLDTEKTKLDIQRGRKDLEPDPSGDEKNKLDLQLGRMKRDESIQKAMLHGGGGPTARQKQQARNRGYL